MVYLVGDFTITKDCALQWAEDYNPVVVECVIDGLARRGIDFDTYTAPE
jgi:hypothetical protein